MPFIHLSYRGKPTVRFQDSNTAEDDKPLARCINSGKPRNLEKDVLLPISDHVHCATPQPDFDVGRLPELSWLIIFFGLIKLKNGKTPANHEYIMIRGHWPTGQSFLYAPTLSTTGTRLPSRAMGRGALQKARSLVCCLPDLRSVWPSIVVRRKTVGRPR
jgi:hypothetical protein